MPPYSILMFCFSGALLLYAALLALTKNCGLIPRSYAAREKDKKAYAVTVAKIVALTAIPPVHSGIAAMFNGALAVSVLIVEMVMAIWIGTAMTKR